MNRLVHHGIRRAALLAGLIVAASTCGDGPALGTYQLVAINGSAVPATMASGTRIQSGTLTLGDNRSFSNHFAVCVGWPNLCSSGTMRGEGSWTADGSKITFTHGSTTSTATFSDGAIHWSWPNDTFEFRR